MAVTSVRLAKKAILMNKVGKVGAFRYIGQLIFFDSDNYDLFYHPNVGEEELVDPSNEDLAMAFLIAHPDYAITVF